MTDSASTFQSSLAAGLPTGPFFIDDHSCRCALQDALDKEAWRCIHNVTVNIYRGQTGKWFFASEQNNSKSLEEPPASNNNPPDTSTPYAIVTSDNQTRGFQTFADATGSNDAQDAVCSGKNDTRVSAQFYKELATFRSGALTPCWQPGAIPLVLQTPAQWNQTGCALGFYCK